MACDFYCCLLPQCEALRTCRSGFPIAKGVMNNGLFAIHHRIRFISAYFRFYDHSGFKKYALASCSICKYCLTLFCNILCFSSKTTSFMVFRRTRKHQRHTLNVEPTLITLLQPTACVRFAAEAPIDNFSLPQVANDFWCKLGLESFMLC